MQTVQKRKTWLKRILICALVIFTAAIGLVILKAPAIAAVACPGCYGLERVSARVYMETAAGKAGRDLVQAEIVKARKRVKGFYGSLSTRPYMLICITPACDRKLGGKGARATTYFSFGASLIRVSSRGVSETFFSHEMSHAELNARLGFVKLITGTLPAWFNEGLAVVVSWDKRYITSMSASQPKCSLDTSRNLPASPFRWLRQAGKDRQLYQRAACRVLQWMQRHGGKAGVLMAISRLSAGQNVSFDR